MKTKSLPSARTVPLKPRNVGCIGASAACWSSTSRCVFWIRSRMAYAGHSLRQPLPMPFEPLTSSMGTTGVELRFDLLAVVRHVEDGVVGREDEARDRLPR